MSRSRRGMILFLVLMVVALSAMIATSVVHSTLAERVNINSAQRRTQARLLAVTGVQSIMHELARQRDDMLSGRIPTVTREGVVFRESLGGGGQGTERIGLWRVVASQESDGRERLIVAESAKLDANWATTAMLTASDAMTSGAAQDVVGKRSQRRFAAASELAKRGTQVRNDRVSVFNADAAEPGGPAGSRSQPRGEDEPLRLRVDRAWSPEFEEQAKRMLGDPLADHLREMIGKGNGFTTDRALFGAALAKGLKPPEIESLLDWCLTGGDAVGIRLGRVNINQAPLEVIAAIPGFTTQSAQAVVSRRSTLTAELGTHPAWPFTQGLMKPEEFAVAIDWIAVRTLQWRVRIEAGIKIDENSTTAPETDDLRDRIVIDAVIDLADGTPRLAMLRDITRSGDVELRDQAAIVTEGRTPEPPSSSPAGKSSQDSSLKIDAGLKLGGLAPESLSIDTGEPEPQLVQPTARPAASPPLPPPAPGRIGRWTTGR